jgi:hypothetical protein
MCDCGWATATVLLLVSLTARLSAQKSTPLAHSSNNGRSQEPLPMNLRSAGKRAQARVPALLEDRAHAVSGF